MRSISTPSELNAEGFRALADALGDAPETVISVHVLRRGLARAYLAGAPDRFEAAVVRNLAFSPDELIAFGANPKALWALLRSLDRWSCVEVDRAVAPAIGSFVAAAASAPPRFLDAVYHVADRAIPRVPLATVRLLTPADFGLLERAPPAVRGAGYRSATELLVEGIVAAAIVDDRIVAIAHTAARTARHADVGVATLPAWRGRGLATAAAALVAERVQAAGQTPVWSTGDNNRASLRVAEKLGFREVARRRYVILPRPADGVTPDRVRHQDYTEGSMVRSLSLDDDRGRGEPR